MNASFGVGRDERLGIVEGQSEVVLRVSMQVAQREREGTQLHIGTQEGEQMGSALVLTASPTWQIVKSIGGVLVGSIINEGVHSSFEAHLGVQPIGHTGTQPRSWQGEATLYAAVKLIVGHEQEGIEVRRKHTIALGTKPEGEATKKKKKKTHERGE